MRRFKAGIVQMDICSGDVKKNLAVAQRRIAALSDRGARLVLLPEMWSTGFSYDRLESLCATTPGVLEALLRLSEDRALTIIGSMPERQSGHIYNTAYIVDRGAVAARYSKVHLFSPTGEDRFFRAGAKAVMANTTLGPIGLMICYDLRFPELCRTVVLRGAHMVAVVAQWPQARIGHWDALLRARAVENLVFVFGANRCGRDGELVFGGHSRIVSPWGVVLARGRGRPESLLASIDITLVRDARRQIPCLKERVPEAYD
ncbi:MAG: carbon-nitrogen family hydrolase [Deltaproteobacteria bacterium]|nr:carbon-nitrogen family hydrolase [Deltaproteobacteria bacterium]